jgi:hypothetical protein
MLFKILGFFSIKSNCTVLFILIFSKFFLHVLVQNFQITLPVLMNKNLAFFLSQISLVSVPCSGIFLMSSQSLSWGKPITLKILQQGC